MSDDLEPIDPRTAKQMYLDARSHELADSTIQSHRYRLKQFVQWCEGEDIENLNNFSGRDIHQYRVKRREEDELATATMKGQLATLRAFLRFLATIDGVKTGLDEKIILPTLTKDDAREEMLDPERAEAIFEHLEQFRYATLEHALLTVLWHTGIRIGAAVGLDVDDYNSDEQYLIMKHRPEQGTSLKNGKKSERVIALRDHVSTVLDDWLKVNHTGIKDEHNREPLFVTRHGRLSRNRGRTIAYQYTRPCIYSDTCPHDRDMNECEAIPTSNANACPSVLSPHPIRRGSITHHLRKDTPDPVVSSRMDVSSDVIDMHYDQRSNIEKMRQRRRYLPDE